MDDEESQLSALREFIPLFDPGIEVDSIPSPTEVVDRLPYVDCVVSDYQMPEMDGITLAKKVRQVSTVPFIMYTGRGSEEVAEKGFEAGVDIYLRKEVNPSHYRVLTQDIRQAVDRHRSESLYRSIAESSLDALIITQGERIVYANRAMGDLTGVEEASILGKSLIDWVVPASRRRVRERLFNWPDGKPPRRVGFKVRRLDGSEKRVDASVSPIRSIGERSLLIFLRDITERLKMRSELTQVREITEQALRSERQALTRLNALHRSVSELSVAKTMDEVYGIALGTVVQVLGFKWAGIGVVEGDRILFRHVHDERGTGHALIGVSSGGPSARAARTGKTAYVPSVEMDPAYPQGKALRCASEISVPVLNDAGVIAVINVESPIVDGFDSEDQNLLEVLTQNIASAHRRIHEAEKQRRHSARIEALYNHSSSLAKATTLREIVYATGEAVQSGLGFQHFALGIVEGRSLRFQSYVGVGETKPFSLILDGPGVTVRAVRVGETQYVSDTSLDQAFVQNPEEDKYLSEVAIPFFIAGDPAGVIDVESTARNGFTGDDIRLLEALSLHVAGAYERVLGRAVKPSGEVEAEKMIAAGKVASMVAHDLRGPLQLIKNMVFLARQNPAKTDLYLTRILDAVNYSGGILEDIRSTLKQTEVAKKPTDLRELLSTSLEALEGNGAVRVVFEASELGAVDVDPLKMRRVFDNLIRNAVEAMPHGGQLTVRGRRSGGSVSVTVSDTGEGIPPEFKARLFRLFETTKRNGTGLGLAYCKQTVEAHGGEIAVESEVGKGTSITVTLPATVP